MRTHEGEKHDKKDVEDIKQKRKEWLEGDTNNGRIEELKEWKVIRWESTEITRDVTKNEENSKNKIKSINNKELSHEEINRLQRDIKRKYKLNEHNQVNLIKINDKRERPKLSLSRRNEHTNRNNV